MSDADLELFEADPVPEPERQAPETTRMVFVDSCGPSPLRCLYTKGLVYEVHAEDVQWVTDNQYGYVEGTPPIPPLADRLKAQEAARVADEKAKQEAHAEKVREMRAARMAAIEAEMAEKTEAARAKLAAARAAAKAVKLAEHELALAENAAASAKAGE